MIHPHAETLAVSGAGTSTELPIALLRFSVLLHTFFSSNGIHMFPHGFHWVVMSALVLCRPFIGQHSNKSL